MATCGALMRMPLDVFDGDDYNVQSMEPIEFTSGVRRDKDSQMSPSTRSRMNASIRMSSVQRTDNLRQLIRWLCRSLDKETTMNIVGYVFGGLRVRSAPLFYRLQRPEIVVDMKSEDTESDYYDQIFPMMIPRRLWQGQPLTEDPPRIIRDAVSTDQVARVDTCITDRKHMDSSRWDWGCDPEGPRIMFGSADLKLVRALLKAPNQSASARVVPPVVFASLHDRA